MNDSFSLLEKPLLGLESVVQVFAVQDMISGSSLSDSHG